MLYEFLKSNRTELITRCREKAAKRALPRAMPADIEYGIPQFLSQLIETFRVEQTPEALARHKAAGHGKPSLALVPSDIPGTAAKHGDEMRRHGLTIDQVVHRYGDVCQALTELAMEKDAPITVDEFHTFNRCLDDAIADAVTAYSTDVGDPISKPDVRVKNDLDGSLATMRNLVETAVLSFEAIAGGHVGLKGTTANMLEKSLLALRVLIDGALAAGNVETPVKRIH